MKKTIITVLALILSFAMAASSFACTGAYVGKGVSETGTTIIARTRDSNNLSCICRRTVTPRVENEPGSEWKETNGFLLKLPATTYGYVSGPLSTSSGRGTFGASALNDEGVAVTATVTAATRQKAEDADPFVETGISEACIGDIIALNCKTARESVDFLARVMEESGNAEPSVILVADQDEAWYIETYTGHQWAAIRLPDDKCAVFGNQFNLDPLHETYPEIRMSKDIESAMKKGGAAVYTDGKFDLFETYIGSEKQGDYANMRNWYGQFLFNKNDPGKYKKGTKYELLFTPKKKMTVRDIQELDRSRFEGTEFCPDENGRDDIRIIGIETQYSVDITEVHHDLPRPLSLVSWVCLDNAEHSVFVPFSNLITKTSNYWSRDVKEGFPYEDETIAFYAFQNLCVLSVTGRDTYGKGVRAYWRAVEDHLLKTYPEVLMKTAELYKADKEAAKKYMTDYSVKIQNAAYFDARKVKAELLHYLALNQRTFDNKINNEAGGIYEHFEHEPFASGLADSIAERYAAEK